MLQGLLLGVYEAILSVQDSVKLQIALSLVETRAVNDIRFVTSLEDVFVLSLKFLKVFTTYFRRILQLCSQNN